MRTRSFSLSARPRRAGWLTTDLVVALALLALVILPLAHGLLGERLLLRAELRRAAVMTLLDGELEILLAGQAAHLPEGESELALTGVALRNMPEGRCLAVRSGRHLRLEWRPTAAAGRATVTREAWLP